MMIQGIVQAVSGGPDKAFQTPHGPAYNLKFKMHDGQWYKFPFCKTDEAPPLSKGQHVGFDFKVNQRINPNTQQPIVDNEVIKATFLLMGGAPMQQQQYPQQQMDPSYQQPAQQPMQQPVAQPNWSGNEGMASGVAIQCASRMTTDPGQIMILAAQILMIQDELMVFLKSGGSSSADTGR